MRLPGFLGDSYGSRIHSLKRSRTVNLIPTLDESHGEKIKAVGGFIRTPGLSEFTTGLDGAVRGLHSVGDRGFAIAGTKLYELTAAGVATERGTVMADTRRAYMADNSNAQLFIQNGTHGYVLTLATNQLTVVTNATFEDVYGGCVFRDGYIVRVLEGSNRWQYSALNNAASWQGLNGRSRTTDALRGISIAGTNLWLFGSAFTEARYNSGATSVWSAVPGGLMGVGLLAPESLAMLGQIPYWLGISDGGIVACRATGGEGFERISTNALESAWTEYGADAASAWGYAYGDRGGGFYVLSFPDRNTTFVYDSRTGFWHEEGQLYVAATGYQHVEGRCHMYFGNKHLVGSRRTGTIYALDAGSDTLTGADPVRWLRRCPCVHGGASARVSP